VGGRRQVPADLIGRLPGQAAPDGIGEQHPVHRCELGGQALQAAWSRGDAAGYAALFTDDADFVAWNGTHGRGLPQHPPAAAVVTGRAGQAGQEPAEVTG
jgi:hypothetical protein